MIILDYFIFNFGGKSWNDLRGNNTYDLDSYLGFHEAKLSEDFVCFGLFGLF